MAWSEPGKDNRKPDDQYRAGGFIPAILAVFLLVCIPVAFYYDNLEKQDQIDFEEDIRPLLPAGFCKGGIVHDVETQLPIVREPTGTEAYFKCEIV